MNGEDSGRLSLLIWPVTSSCFIKEELTTDSTDVTDVLFHCATRGVTSAIDDPQANEARSTENIEEPCFMGPFRVYLV